MSMMPATAAQRMPSQQANFYEKALFVKGDLATDRSVANATALPFALCFYPHFRGAHASVARCIMGSVFSG
jgi:hypothetical protein